MFTRFLGRVLLLALVAVLIPACKGSQAKGHPVLTRATPVFLSTGAAHHPLILLEFNQAMDPASINNVNITINSTATGAEFAPGFSVTYIPGLFQVLIVPLAPLPTAAPGPQFDVIVYPQVRGSNGLSVQVPPTGGVANRFSVGAAVNTFKPVFNTPTVVPGGAQGTLTFAWVQATENAVPISANYDVYMSLTTGTVDLISPFFLTKTDNTGFTMGTGGANGTLTPGTTYFFIVVCRDNDGNVTVTNEISATATP